MIARLKGILVSISDEHLVLDVSGVGYQVSVTSSLLDMLPRVGDPLELTIYTEVRETAITLYGFKDHLERQVFLLLQKVKGIGARLALGILSAVGPERILASIAREDLGSLVGVPGIGKKTAERIIVELREQVAQLVAAQSGPLATRIETVHLNRSSTGYLPRSVPEGPAGDAILALQKLGFHEDRARETVAEVQSSATTTLDSGELLRQSLAKMV
jgi:Holliday junction DNA helicase RuvA